TTVPSSQCVLRLTTSVHRLAHTRPRRIVRKRDGAGRDCSGHPNRTTEDGLEHPSVQAFAAHQLRRPSGKIVMASPSPSVLFVYYTHTEQTLKVCDAMADVLRSRGCDVVTAPPEFTDPRFAAKFSSFPFKHVLFDLLSILPAQIARKTGEIAIPGAAK